MALPTLSRIWESAFRSTTTTYGATVDRGLQLYDTEGAYSCVLRLNGGGDKVVVDVAMIDSERMQQGKEVTLVETTDRFCWVPTKSYRVRLPDGVDIDASSAVWV